MQNKKCSILICGYSKSGTTIIAKALAYQTGLEWQNELRSLWGISNYAKLDMYPNDSISSIVRETEAWEKAEKLIQNIPIVKFPEGMLVLNLLSKETNVVCVIRNPLDTVCAYLERKHEFKTLDFSIDEIIRVAQDWNYHVLSVSLAKKDPLLVVYERFVENPNDVLKEIAFFCNLKIFKPAPDWIFDQAQKYERFVPHGQPVRGPGRYRLSFRNKNVINKVLRICSPALNYLKQCGICYDKEELLYAIHN